MQPEVETSAGWIQGTESRGIRIFRGVPYASPPLGPLRFRGPQPVEPWTGTRPAWRAGPAPMQVGLPVLHGIPLAGGRRRSEDCLYLNVFTPGLDGARRPVLVWIHGGGFLVGSGSTPLYDGRALARNGDLVVVTINYRLGALGLLHLDGLFGEAFRGASNAGVRDQMAALEWVRDNIERFGGDPGNVTVCGQSAGAMSVATLLAAPRARKLFHRAICQSGAAHHVQSREQATRVAEVFVGELGGPPADPRAFARIPVERLLKAQGATNRRLTNLERLMVFLPAVDGDLLPEAPLDAIARGATRAVPLLLGTTLDEWKLFTLLDSRVPSMREDALIRRLEAVLPAVAPRAPAAPDAAREYRDAVGARGGQTSPFEIWSAFQSARVFHYPAAVLGAAHADAGGAAYSYLFTWRPPALRRSLGAFHALDIPFVFGLVRHPLARRFTGLTLSAGRLSRQMQGAWIQFARGGDPGHGALPDWERYRAAGRPTMALGRRCYLAGAPLEDERRLWERWSAAPAASE